MQCGRVLFFPTFSCFAHLPAFLPFFFFLFVDKAVRTQRIRASSASMSSALLLLLLLPIMHTVLDPELGYAAELTRCAQGLVIAQHRQSKTAHP